jgi:hypothetical protein
MNGVVSSVGIEVAAVVANLLLGYIALLFRRFNSKLEMVDDHDRAIYGDEKTGWPGLMSLADPDDSEMCTDGGAAPEGGDS